MADVIGKQQKTENNSHGFAERATGCAYNSIPLLLPLLTALACERPFHASPVYRNQEPSWLTKEKFIQMLVVIAPSFLTQSPSCEANLSPLLIRAGSAVTSVYGHMSMGLRTTCWEHLLPAHVPETSARHLWPFSLLILMWLIVADRAIGLKLSKTKQESATETDRLNQQSARSVVHRVNYPHPIESALQKDELRKEEGRKCDRVYIWHSDLQTRQDHFIHFFL